MLYAQFYILQVLWCQNRRLRLSHGKVPGGGQESEKNHPFQQKESEKKLLYAENENLCNSHVLQKATYGPRSWVKNSSTLIQLNFSAISSHKESVGRKKQVR